MQNAGRGLSGSEGSIPVYDELCFWVLAAEQEAEAPEIRSARRCEQRKGKIN